jgi:hypothetical protein
VASAARQPMAKRCMHDNRRHQASSRRCTCASGTVRRSWRETCPPRPTSTSSSPDIRPPSCSSSPAPHRCGGHEFASAGLRKIIVVIYTVA